jgi:hypothetical protein
VFKTYRLIPHPDSLAREVQSVEVDMDIDIDEIDLHFRVDPREAIVIPPWRGSNRADRLWETTCFELFLKPDGGTGYFEINFSPSGEWAAYRFTGYREGMALLELSKEPMIGFFEPEDSDLIGMDLDLLFLPVGKSRMGISVIIEEHSGHRSFWALAHGPGEPDFHNEACFALEVPAANAP